MTKLDELRKLAREATPGPWLMPRSLNGQDEYKLFYNAELVVAMRNNIDALLNIAEAAQKLLDAHDSLRPSVYGFVHLRRALDKLK